KTDTGAGISGKTVQSFENDKDFLALTHIEAYTVVLDFEQPCACCLLGTYFNIRSGAWSCKLYAVGYKILKNLCKLQLIGENSRKMVTDDLRRRVNYKQV